MSRYSNVMTLLDLAEKYEQEPLVELLLDEDTQVEEIAEDIAFVIISLWALVPVERRKEFKERLTDDIVNYEISQMFPDDEKE